jgi:hypothetical protein
MRLRLWVARLLEAGVLLGEWEVLELEVLEVEQEHREEEA